MFFEPFYDKLVRLTLIDYQLILIGDQSFYVLIEILDLFIDLILIFYILSYIFG